MTAASSKSSRVTTVHTPGEAPKNDKPAETSTTGAVAAALAGAAPGVVEGETSQGAPAGGVGLQRQPESDLEAMRERIREEERASIRAEERDRARIELGAQIQAAARVVGEPAAPGAPQRTRGDYRNMHAHEIDPATLTAPVLTKDGYLCPPAPEAKK